MKQVNKDNIKGKVGYEWKKIYKTLAKQDKKNMGFCSKSQFSDACQNAGVNLSNQECTRVASWWDNGENEIDFVRMSKEMGLHQSSLNYYHD